MRAGDGADGGGGSALSDGHRLLKRGHATEMEQGKVEKLRKQFNLENNPPVLTLQPVIGQRESGRRKSASAAIFRATEPSK